MDDDDGKTDMVIKVHVSMSALVAVSYFISDTSMIPKDLGYKNVKTKGQMHHHLIVFIYKPKCKNFI